MDIFLNQHRNGTHYHGGDPFFSDVIFLMLGEGPTDGTQVNPTTGTLLRDEIGNRLQSLGNPPFTTGSTVSASTSGMPFGSSWIRHPGGVDSNNFIGCQLPNFYHPRNNAMTWDGWFQVDDLSRQHTLFSDDSSFGGSPCNMNVFTDTSGFFGASIRTGTTISGTTTSLSFPGSITANTPFHVELWGDATGNWGLALNGVMTTGTIIASSTANSAFLLGCQNPYFPGLFKRVLQGYSKCFRITAAVRHTGNFTPPSTLAEYGP